jgi:hypothetical protein
MHDVHKVMLRASNPSSYSRRGAPKSTRTTWKAKIPAKVIPILTQKAWDFEGCIYASTIGSHSGNSIQSFETTDGMCEENPRRRRKILLDRRITEAARPYGWFASSDPAALFQMAYTTYAYLTMWSHISSSTKVDYDETKTKTRTSILEIPTHSRQQPRLETMLAQQRPQLLHRELLHVVSCCTER